MGNTAEIPCEREITCEVVQTSGEILPPREAHGGGYHQGNLYFFGGVQDLDRTNSPQDDPLEEDDEQDNYIPAVCKNDVFQFNLEKKEWRQIPCSGDMPSPRSGCVCSIMGNYLFIFSGTDPLFGWMNDGFLLDLGSFVWERVQFNGDVPTPRDKSGYVTSPDQSTLFIFGGFGPQEYEFAEDEEETAIFGWFNDVYSFELATRTWRKLSCEGEAPTPRACSGIAFITRPTQIPIPVENQPSLPLSVEANPNITVDSKAMHPEFREGDMQNFLYVFGGRDNRGARTNDVYSLELSTLKWTMHQCRGTHPVNRSFHSVHSLDGDKLIIFGGANPVHDVLNDIFILDTRASTQHAWVKPKIEGTSIAARAFHCAIFVRDPQSKEPLLYIHGGTSKLSKLTGEHLDFLNDLHVMNLSKCFCD
jgi:hypothetical protein